MSQTFPKTQLWFMDWHSRVLDHDPISDYFSPTPFQPGVYPGMSALIALPLNLPCDITFTKRVSMPRPLPVFEAQDAEKGLLFFQLKGHDKFLKSAPVPGKGEITTDASIPKNWERFLPMTEDVMRGLSTLLTPQSASLIDVTTGKALPPIKPSTGFLWSLGETPLPLAANIQNIEQIGRLPARHEAEISFIRNDDQPPFRVHVRRPS